MDFVTGCRRHSIRIIPFGLDCLTKYAHFIPIRTDFSLEKRTKLYLRDVVKLHGVPMSIISDRDPQFTSQFWVSVQKSLGTISDLSTTLHPQTNGQFERPFIP